MKVLVTGAGGFLGGAIARQLVVRGDTVRSFSRGDYAELAELGVVQFRGDLDSAAAVALAVEGCDAVYHVAAKAGSWGAYEDYHRTNVRGTENVLAACRQHVIRDLVYTSSPSVVVHTGDMEGARSNSAAGAGDGGETVTATATKLIQTYRMLLSYHCCWSWN